MTLRIGNHQSLMKPVLSLFQFIIGIVFLASTLVASAGDIAVYGIVKEQRFVQTNDAAPSLESAEPFAFQCFVDATGPGLINDAFVNLPGGGMRTMPPSPIQARTMLDRGEKVTPWATPAAASPLPMTSNTARLNRARMVPPLETPSLEENRGH